MGDRFKTTILHIYIITAVLSGFCAILLFSSKHEPYGNKLTPEFIQSVRYYKLYDNLSDGAILLCVFTAAGIGAIYLYNYLNRIGVTAKYYPVLLLGLMGVIFFVGFTCKAIPKIFNEATVVTATATNTDYRATKSGNGIHYIFYDNGYVSSSATADEYYAARKGAKFYVIMCGDTPIEEFLCSEYILPTG